MAVPVNYRGVLLHTGFRADMVVAESVLIELKAFDRITTLHRRRTLTYLKLSGLRLGLLINFGAIKIAGNIARLVNDLEEL